MVLQFGFLQLPSQTAPRSFVIPLEKASTVLMPDYRKATVFSLLSCSLLLLLFSSALLWKRLDFFWVDDYQLEYLPVYLAIGDAVSQGKLPLLNSGSWVCGNIAGEYQYGVFSFYVLFASWLVSVIGVSLPLKAAFFAIMHLLPLGAGACLLARKRGLTPALSVAVGIVAACNGWMIAWGASNWIPALVSFAWLPWFWWACERIIDQPQNLRRVAVAGFFLYLILTGGWPHTLFMVAVIFVWFGVRCVRESGRSRIFFSLIGAGFVGSALAAPALWAFMEYAGSAARSPFGSVRQETWAVPVTAFWGLFNPSFWDYWTAYRPPAVPMQCLEMAVGFVPAVAFLIGLFYLRRWSRRQYWDLILLFSIAVLSMSSSIGPFRWNFRWLPFFHLVLGLLGCSLIQNLWLEPDKRRSLPLGRGALVLTAVLILVSILFFRDRGPLSWQEYIELLLISSVLLVMNRVRTSTGAYVVTAAIFLSLFSVYWRIPTTRIVYRFPFPPQIADPAPLDHKRLYLSIYELPHTRTDKEHTPSDYWLLARPGNSPLYSGLHFVNGYSPLFPSGLAQVFRFSFNGSIHPDTAAYLIEKESENGRFLDLLGVDGLIFSPHTKSLGNRLGVDWMLHSQSASGAAYHRKTTSGRFRVVRDAASKSPAKIDPRGFALLEEDERKVVLSVEQLSENVTVLYSRPYFSGYRANLNGGHLEVQIFGSSIPAVRVPAGSQGILQLEYAPVSYHKGRIISGLGAVLLVLLALGKRRTDLLKLHAE